MKTKTFTLTHFSLVGFDGISTLWKDFPFYRITRCPVSGAYISGRVEGSLWHKIPENNLFRSKKMTVTGQFKLGEKLTVELNGKRYVAYANFGFDQSILAFSIIGIEGEELGTSIFKNSVKLYTSEPTTPKFLAGEDLFK